MHIKLANTYFFRDLLFDAVEPAALVLFALPAAFRGGSGEVDATDEVADNLVDFLVGIPDWPSSSFLVDRPFLVGRLLGGGESGKGAT